MSQKVNDRKRYDGLDFAKFLCAFMVIAIHVTYFGKEYIDSLATLAVPVFFMITGFFYSSTQKSNREGTQIKKVAGLFLFSNLLYFVWKIFKCILLHESIADYLHSLRSLKLWIDFMVFNESMFSGHLWYLGALLYVLVIILLVDKYSDRKKLYKVIPLLLAINLIFGSYSILTVEVRLPHTWTRNFLFCGLPFFLLGDAAREKAGKATNGQYVAVAVASAVIIIAETVFLRSTGDLFNGDFFAGTSFLAYSLFALFLKNRRISDVPLLYSIAQLGRHTSTITYIIHPIVILIVVKTIEFLGVYVPYLSTVYFYTAPLVILILCTLFTCLYNEIIKKLRSCFSCEHTAI